MANNESMNILGDNCVVANVNGGGPYTPITQIYRTKVLVPCVIDGINIITQSDLSDRNTKYVIKYNFFMKEDEITIPKDCIIEFDGGSICSNNVYDGIINFNDTILSFYGELSDVFKDIDMRGTWKIDSPDSAIFAQTANALADKKDTTDGMGKIYLKKNKPIHEQMTQSNTIYVIQYDFDLGGKELTVPENCVLEFDGGSLRNGGVNFNGCVVNGIRNLFSKITVNGFINNEVDADWFIGNDYEKLTNAINYGIFSRRSAITISRSYDLTGNTVLIDLGLRGPNDVGKYSRNPLIIRGKGEGRLIKKDVGYMFSAQDISVDMYFENINFVGHVNDESDLNSIVDMYVFDCNKLGNLHTINCNFCYCGCVYYQDKDGSNPMQGIISNNNTYAKNKGVLMTNQSWSIIFNSDIIEHGLYGIKPIANSSYIRGLKISNCCIEGFVHETALNLKCIVVNAAITNNYFEQNICSIDLTGHWNGIISGNSFHSRNTIDKSIEIYCIKLAYCGEGAEITANAIPIIDEKMYLLYFDKEANYYNTSDIITGSNYVEKGSLVTNEPSKVISEKTVIKENNKTYHANMTERFKEIWPNISGGNAFITVKNKICSIAINDLVVDSPITSDYVTFYRNDTNPLSSAITCGILTATDTNNIGFIKVYADGDIGLRINNAGTYSGSITLHCK